MRTFVVIIVAFAIGYKLISWLMDRLQLSRTAPDTTGPGEDIRATPELGGHASAAWRTDSAVSSADDRTRGQSYEVPEARYARVLGLPRVYTGAEITARYRTLIAQYHPDQVRHLGPDLQELAQRKTRECAEAYEYFRVKYNLR